MSNAHHGGARIAAAVRAVLGLAAATMVSSAALADDAAAGGGDKLEEVIVSGYRASLMQALDTKKNSAEMVDVINAEDIAKFPDSNLAESLQRLPGVALDRDNGEGRSITVRGLGSDFTRVQLNGLETLSTAASSDSGTAPNRGRGFDFNVFASDLFSSLAVQKTASAATDEGSLGATIDLVTGRPLTTGNRAALSVEDAYYESGETHNPRVAGLLSHTWLDNSMGLALSFAYSKRDSAIDRFRRQAGQNDYTYRSSSYAGSEAPARAGFSAPAGTTFGTAITNPQAVAAETGSDPAAYALLYPGAPYSTAGTFADSTVRIPSLINVEEQELSQKRTGFTLSYQWKITDKTQVNLDGVYSKFEQGSEVNQIQSVGLNRNNTNANYNTATAATSVATKRGTYPICTDQTALAYRDPITCGGANAMPGGVFPGFGTTSFSTNPHNLDTYDYYNNPRSPGYGGAAAVAAANGIYGRAALIGRPGVDVLGAHVDAGGNADYLALRNVDWRSATDASYFTTTFKQASFNLQQEILSNFRADLLVGASSSLNSNQGELVEFNRMDSPETFVYDERAHGQMPSLSYGFDLSNPANWTLVKGFSVLRNYLRETDNRYVSGHLNFEWNITEDMALQFGWTHRTYEFSTNQGQRLSNEAVNPTLQELGLSAQQLGRVYQFGQGLSLPSGTPKSFFAPNINAFRNAIGFDCNCVNEWGDWRLSYLSNPGNQYTVDEKDNSYFVQYDWNTQVFDHKFFGNIGVRFAQTDVDSVGYTTNVTATGPRPIAGTNSYDDTLPSLNAAYELIDNVYMRFGAAKVMARPLLANLAPSMTGLTTPTTQDTIGAVTIGNPKLHPFRATNYDFSVEWYFGQGGLLSGAYFIKDVSNFPQTVASSGPMQSLLDPAAFQSFLETQTAAQQQWLLTGNGGNPGLYSIRQFADAPGGKIKGYELTYQQNFTFLPGWLQYWGTIANYTHLSSHLSYILDPGSTTAPVSPQVIADGPFIGASPDAANFTLYYETKTWSARASVAYRSSYVTTYPIAAGTCAPGVCDSPLVNDFLGSDSTTNVDASFSYSFNDNLMFTLDLLNITNQPDSRWAYQADKVVTQYSAPGRQYFLGARYQF
jgi:iron complex outermembrane recepter protein